jgi:cysteine-rich repeat protein
VWYTVIGTGGEITASTCNLDAGAQATNYDTKVSVYCLGCNDLFCIDGNDDGSPSGANPDPDCVIPETGSSFNRASTVTWCSQAEATYRILVHGFGTSNGDFQLNLTAGDACSSTDECIPPEPVCGNGEIEDGEECDDGNTIPGDGCDEFCQLEPTGACCVTLCNDPFQASCAPRVSAIRPSSRSSVSAGPFRMAVAPVAPVTRARSRASRSTCPARLWSSTSTWA